MDRMDGFVRDFYAAKNHDSRIHQYVFQGSQYIGQLDFWSADEIEEFGKLLLLTETSNILDIGSGLGGPLCYLVQKFSSRGIGVDISATNVEQANKRKTKMGLENRVNFILEDILELDLDRESFDAVICIDSMVHIEESQKLANRCSSWLKPRGRFVVAVECIETDAPLELVNKRNKIGAVFSRTAQSYREIFKENKFALIEERIYPQKRYEFAVKALEWMNMNKSFDGWESMEMIKTINELGYAKQHLFLLTKRDCYE